MAGHSILPLVRDQVEDWPDDVFIQISESQVGRAVRTSRWKYSVSAPEADPWQDQAAGTYKEEFLYDLEADPHELTNLIGYESHQEVTAVLRQRLLRYIREVEGTQPKIIAAPSKPSGQRIVTPQENHL